MRRVPSHLWRWRRRSSRGSTGSIRPCGPIFGAQRGRGHGGRAAGGGGVALGPARSRASCGVPVSVKDTIEMAGLPTTYGSLAFKDNHRGRRRNSCAGCDRRERSCSARPTRPEFALHPRVSNRLSGPGANPWNLEHTCGGSSGGRSRGSRPDSARSRSERTRPGRSACRQPITGFFGIKPTFQRIPSVQSVARVARAVAQRPADPHGPGQRPPDARDRGSGPARSGLSVQRARRLPRFSEGSIRGCRVA